MGHLMPDDLFLRRAVPTIACHAVAVSQNIHRLTGFSARVRYGVLHFEQKCLRTYMEFVQ
jgi:hypothetical protein